MFYISVKFSIANNVFGLLGNRKQPRIYGQGYAGSGFSLHLPCPPAAD